MSRSIFGGNDPAGRGIAWRPETAIAVTVYSDAACTVLADLLTYPGGTAIAGSVLTLSAHSPLPLFQGPDGADVLYVIDGRGSSPVTIYPRTTDLLFAEDAADLARSNAAYAPVAEPLAVKLSTVTAADDLIVGSGNAAVQRLAVAASRIIGKKATGGTAALTAAEAMVILDAIGGTVTAWAPTTAYVKGQLVTQLGSIWEAIAAFTSAATFDPTNWTLIEGGGFGFPYTVDPGIPRATDLLSVPAANSAHYARCLHGGAISKVGLYVGASSGNISVAAYRSSGAGRLAVPTTQLATSGAVACPTANAYAEVSLGATVTLMPGDWIGISADNVTATFSTLLATPADDNRGLGRQFRQSTAHPLPGTPASLTATMGRTFVLIGVT